METLHSEDGIHLTSTGAFGASSRWWTDYSTEVLNHSMIKWRISEDKLWNRMNKSKTSQRGFLTPSPTIVLTRERMWWTEKESATRHWRQLRRRTVLRFHMSSEKSPATLLVNLTPWETTWSWRKRSGIRSSLHSLSSWMTSRTRILSNPTKSWSTLTKSSTMQTPTRMTTWSMSASWIRTIKSMCTNSRKARMP